MFKSTDEVSESDCERSSVLPLTPIDLVNSDIKRQLEEFTSGLPDSLKQREDNVPVEPDDDDVPHYEPTGDDYGDADGRTVPKDDEEYEGLDKYLSKNLYIKHDDDTMAYGRVVRRKRDSNDNLIGRSHPNPLLDSSLYEVEFGDGNVQCYTANTVAENLVQDIDGDSDDHGLFDEIVDHQKLNDAIPKSEGTYMRKGRKAKKRTVRGWRLCVDGKTGRSAGYSYGI